jgi:hypothetical protein
MLLAKFYTSEYHSSSADFELYSTFGTPKEFAKGILDKARGSIQSRAASLLVNAIFGGGNNSGNLSEESLEQIRDIVRDALIESREYNALALLNALNSTMTNYHSGLSQNYYNAPLLSNLVQDAGKLANHEAFNKQYNQKYFYNIQNYMLVASLVTSIYTEQYLRGQVSKSFVKSKADLFADKLQNFKVDVISHVNSNLYINNCYPSGYFTICTFRDNISTNTPYPWSVEFYDGDYEYTPSHYEQEQRQYKINSIIDGVDEVIVKLRNVSL